jgi:ribonuclease Y
MDPLVIIAAFSGGVILSGLFATLLFRRLRIETEDRIKERMALNDREARLQLEQWTHERERELQQKQDEAEGLLKERERAVAAREDETVSLFLNAEKDREVNERRRKELDVRLDKLEAAEDRAREQIAEYRNRLLSCSGLTAEEARSELFDAVRLECDTEIRELREERLNHSEKEIEEEARKKLLTSMQRLSATSQEDITATLVAIPSDDMKGRIIGREGRNIKAFESVTGTTLLIDETPDSVLISSFDPVRRETARIALEKLIKDGRIHPASIEESVQKAEEQIQHSVVESGEDALRRLRLSKMHPEVVAALGRLRFRLSNNQNSLEHSIEVANLCSLMGAELGLDTQIAKRCGLLHDIGKVLDEEHEGSHAVAGAYFLKRLGNEDPRVINAVAAHHGEVEAESPYVALVMIADSLSATRPGARADSLDGYLQRGAQS